MNPGPAIVLIGAGNLGFRLGIRMAECGIAPVQVFSRSMDKARRLGQTIGAEYVNRLDDVRPDADVCLIAVRDDAISEVAGYLSKVLRNDPLAAHTSGATPSSLLAPHFRRYGVFYPLQTFSAGREPEFGHIPVCVFSPLQEDLEILRGLAGHISTAVHVTDDDQRATLHLAAVFVNNFVNHLYHTGYRILREKGLPFELLLPLIEETAQKLQPGLDPEEVQTGPARRGDSATVQRHLEHLRRHPEWQELYRMLTASINPDLVN